MVRFFYTILAVSGLCLMASPAYAYIGPGLGIVAVWGLFGPVAAIVATVLLVAYFPLRYLYKKHKNKKKLEAAAQRNANEVDDDVKDDEDGGADKTP